MTDFLTVIDEIQSDFQFEGFEVRRYELAAGEALLVFTPPEEGALPFELHIGFRFRPDAQEGRPPPPTAPPPSGGVSRPAWRQRWLYAHSP